MNAMQKLQTPVQSVITQVGMNSRKPVFTLSALVLVLSVGEVPDAETRWSYNSFFPTGSAGGTGYIELDESATGATLQLFANGMNHCFRGGQPTSVARTPETMTIAVTRRKSGCAEVRFTLKANGGGIRETKVDGNWVPMCWTADSLNGRPSPSKKRNRRRALMNRVFKKHSVTMPESDNGMSPWRPNRTTSSQTTKMAWKSAMH